MDDRTSQRGVFRLGVMITGMAGVILTIAAAVPIDNSGQLWLLALGAVVAVGVGLMLRARIARALGCLIMLAGGVTVPVSLIRSLTGSRFPGADPTWILAVANAVATTVLLTWMFLRAIPMLLGRPWRTTVFTARLVGWVLAVVAAEHLWLAFQIGFASTGSWSIHVGPEGTQLIGFTGWPLWHGALLVLAAVLIAGPRAMLVHAATGLLVLLASVVPLVIVGMIQSDLFGFEWALLGMVMFPIYLAWWLRDELRRAEGAAHVPA